MWIRASGRLSENIIQLTTPVSSHFLIIGDEAALVDTSIASMSGKLLEELKQFLPADIPLKSVFLTHAHFDHVGGLPALRTAFPELEVICSPLCQSALSDQAVLERFYEQNRRAAEAMNAPMELSFAEWSAGFAPGRVVGDGDSLALGGDVEVKAFSSLGHSSDSMSYYVRPDGAVAVGDSIGGYHGRGKFSVAFGSSKNDFLASVDRIASLDVKTIGLGHAGALSGDLTRQFLDNVRTTANNVASNIREQLAQGKLKDEVCENLYLEMLEQDTPPDGPFTISAHEALAEMVSGIADEDR